MDGDTSTNDTILGLASGAVGETAMFAEGSQEAQQLEAAVTALLQVLLTRAPILVAHALPVH